MNEVMERHPLPQHVSGYEFRLIGNMTLKQFGELALGVILAMICWSLPIAPFFKYPLIGFFGFLGVALAFIPIQEQPLDKWIINFFRSVYSPTQYLWHKSEVSLDFLERPSYPRPPTIIKPVAQPADRAKLEEYLKTVPAAPETPLDQLIESQLQKISSFFGAEEVVVRPSKPAMPEERLPESPKETGVRPLPRPKIPKQKIPKPLGEKEVAKPEPVPEIPTFKRKPRLTVAPKFEPELPMPSRPTVPNVLVGMVLDAQGKILPDVIIEIRDDKGFPVRALKANKLGQFQIATPLKKGTYEIELEQEGYRFDIIKFEAKGKIIEPMEIKAK